MMMLHDENGRATPAPQIRLRRHPDGRVALWTHPSVGRYPWSCGETGQSLTENEVSGPGWVELLVTELPEPDGSADAVNDGGEDVKTPQWTASWGETVTAWIEGVETPVWELKEDLAVIRSDALKMLAAVAACETYRAEREAKT
jgi:hypothetical protein